MNWMELHIDTSPAGLDPVSDMLRDLGIEGLVIEDEGDFHNFLEQNQQYWDFVDEDLNKSMAGKCRITFYLEEGDPGLATMAQVRIGMSAMKKEHPEYAPMLLTVGSVADADWENNWKAYYKPMEIGQRLLVIPDWEEADSKGRVALRLNPGLIFGTGSHSTTRLCLQALERNVKPGMRVLDLGCGSGILSIAALLLGADKAFGCDIDDKAVDVAYENAALNGIGRDRYTVRAGDVLGDKSLRREIGGGYDIVVANIVADVIIGLSPAVGSMMGENGLFLCSGIIEERAPEVRAKLESEGFAILEENTDQGWYSYLCRRAN